MPHKRREFIKQLGALSGAGLLSAGPVMALAESAGKNDDKKISFPNNFTISILQTTDVHCQVHPHDELFWENNKAVFRKTGGYAHLAAYLRKERKKNPD